MRIGLPRKTLTVNLIESPQIIAGLPSCSNASLIIFRAFSRLTKAKIEILATGKPLNIVSPAASEHWERYVPVKAKNLKLDEVHSGDWFPLPLLCCTDSPIIDALQPFEPDEVEYRRRRVAAGRRACPLQLLRLAP